MYFNFLVDVPKVHGKITRRKKNGSIYVELEVERQYDSKRKYTTVKRVTIGKQSMADPMKMQPNQNFLKYFPETEFPEENSRTDRSSCLRIGAYLIIRKIIQEYGLWDILAGFFKSGDVGLLLDLAAYSIITENNAGQYYPAYAYNHPLFTDEMKIYSDSKVSDFLNSVKDEQIVGFLNEWNENRDHREKIYISYDSTNKNCQSGDIRMLEYGHAKENEDMPIFNYSIAYDTNNREPLFYEKYPGSINDVSQLQFMLAKANSYGYKRIGFILDRGYFSKSNIEYMDECGYSFVMMVKGMASFVNELVLENKGKFENNRSCNISEYRVYGTTVKKKLYETDKKDRFFHIYHSSSKESQEREVVESRIEQMTKFLMSHTNEVRTFGGIFDKYFELYYNEQSGKFLYPVEKSEVIEEELSLCGYFVIVTSEKMTAKEAIELYKSRDASEKLFRGDKSYLGNKCLRVYSDESASAKIFIEFIALIIRSRIYTELKDAMKEMDKKPNFMTVPAAIRELEKIEMVRQLDNVYRLDHAVTATQKTILKAFDLGLENVKYRAAFISEELK